MAKKKTTKKVKMTPEKLAQDVVLPMLKDHLAGFKIESPKYRKDILLLKDSGHTIIIDVDSDHLVILSNVATIKGKTPAGLSDTLLDLQSLADYGKFVFQEVKKGVRELYFSHVVPVKHLNENELLMPLAVFSAYVPNFALAIKPFIHHK